MNGTGKSIAVDWIGRDLYWIEEESRGKFAIKSYDLNRNNRHSNTIMERDYTVGKVAVNPYDRYRLIISHMLYCESVYYIAMHIHSSVIYWSEYDHSGQGHIMQVSMEGSNEVTSLFHGNKVPKHHRQKRVAQVKIFL